MTADLPGERRNIDELRELLETADASGSHDAAWIRLELAKHLIVRGAAEEDNEDIQAGIGYARTGLSGLTPPADGPDLDLALAFNSLGVGHFLRSQLVPATAREDLDLAVEAYRRSIALLPDSDPAVGDVTAWLGVALATAIHRDVVELDDLESWNLAEWDALDERLTAALKTLEDGRQGPPPGDPLGSLALYWRAMMRMIRYLYFGGRAEDCQAAQADFEAILELPGCATEMANTCNAYIAFLHYYRALPEAFRQRGRKPSLADVARAVTTGIAIDPETARTALARLDRIDGRNVATQILDGLVPWLRTVVKAAATDTAPDVEDLMRAVAGLRDAGDGDLRSLIEIVRSIQVARSGRPEDLGSAADMFARAVEDLGDDNPLRDALRGMLGQALDLASGEVPSRRPAPPEERKLALELLEQVLRELPHDHPDRASTLTRLVATLGVGMGHKYSRERVQRVRALVLEAVDRPARDQDNEAVNQLLLALMDGYQSLLGDDDARHLDNAIERLQRVLALLPPEHPLRKHSVGLLTVLLAQRFSRAGGLEDLDAAGHYAQILSEANQVGDLPKWDSGTTIQWFLAALPVLRNIGHHDVSILEEAATRLTAVAARLPEDHPLRGRMESDLHTFEFAHGLFGPDGLDTRTLQADPERFTAPIESMAANARELRPDDPFYPVEMGTAGNAKIGYGLASRDLGTIDEGLAMLADAHGAASTTWPLRTWLVGLIGLGLLIRYELSRDRADLSNAVDRLEEARRGDETDPLGSMTALILNTLAMAYHMRADARLNDQRRAAEAGLASLRARAWGVMLQSNTELAFEASVAAAGEAAEVALRCVADGLTDTAVEALEWGRAMVLHTATTDTGLSALLRKDRPDLADEWEAAMTRPAPAPWYDDPPAVPDLTEIPLPSDLRERVMAAIKETDLERRLFRPATPNEIATTLRDAGAAALAYLVPRDNGRTGLALVVDADGETRPIPLPRLATGPNSRVEAFLRAQRDRGRAEPETAEGEQVHRRWRYALNDLCDWAWTAALDPLLDAIGGVPGRVPRLILVPVGELGAIPWHAARRIVADGVTRYACQDAMISYAASARQFVDARRHGHRPWPSAAVLVRARGLYWASKEIEVIRRHYPDGRMLGGRLRDGSPPATARDVLALLPGPHSVGASLLHLGCHARTASRPVDSHLVLADDELLRMTDILRQARARPPGEPGGLVVLAACGSDVTSDHHDEALTLATAFLAAGAVGVVGTRWPVDDYPTLLFTTMFHHYLNAGYDDPAVALRATQLWMLNRRRSVPADLSGVVSETSFEEPESWAAFTYQGR